MRSRSRSVPPYPRRGLLAAADAPAAGRRALAAGLLTPRGTDNLCGRVWAHLWVHTRPHTRNKNNNIVQKATPTERTAGSCPPRMPRAVLRFEEAGGQRLPLGGKHGYLGVRGGQGLRFNVETPLRHSY